MTLETVGAIIGGLVVALIVWHMVKNGIARKNGDVDEVNSSFDHTRGRGNLD